MLKPPKQMQNRPFVEITEKDKVQLSITIEGLWKEENVFNWTLNPDVNILSGANGSGKSTVLRILDAILTGKDDKLRVVAEYDENSGPSYYSHIEEFTKTTVILNDCKVVLDGIVHDSDRYHDEAISNLTIDFFASLDQKIKTITGYNGNIKSQIDIDLYQHQIRYTKYLLYVSQKAEKAYANGENVTQNLSKIYAQKSLFFDIIDTLFSETNKKIDRESADLQFIKNENKDNILTVYKLSAGEKQILLILLKSLLQNNLPAIYILDEPEISMHPDWQEHLIDNIRKLNPNVMVIIATHSPDIIVNGWLDKVVDMRDLLKPLTTEMKHGA